MRIPKPGRAIGTSRTGRPIIVLLEILGRRWALRVLWELHRNGACSFRSLQSLCGDISPTVLNSRLAELREAGVIQIQEGGGYVISKEGRKLSRIIDDLNTWAKGWADRTVTAAMSAKPNPLKKEPMRKSSRKKAP